MRYFTKDKIWIFFLMVSQQKNYIRRNKKLCNCFISQGKKCFSFFNGFPAVGWILTQLDLWYFRTLLCSIYHNVYCLYSLYHRYHRLQKKKPPKKTFLSIFERYSLIIAKVCEYWLTIVCIRTLLPTLFDEI